MDEQYRDFYIETYISEKSEDSLHEHIQTTDQKKSIYPERT